MTAITNLLQGIDIYSDEIPTIVRHANDATSSAWIRRNLQYSVTTCKIGMLFCIVIMQSTASIYGLVKIGSGLIQWNLGAGEFLSYSFLYGCGISGGFTAPLLHHTILHAVHLLRTSQSDLALSLNEEKNVPNLAKDIFSLYLAFKGRHADELNLIVRWIIRQNEPHGVDLPLLAQNIAVLRHKIHAFD